MGHWEPPAAHDEQVELGAGVDELEDEGGYRTWSHGSWPEKHDPRMLPRTMLSHVGKIQVEGEQHPLFGRRRSSHLLVRFSEETFLIARLRIDAGLLELGGQLNGEVFVEFDRLRHEAVIFQTFSRASSAA